MFKIFLPSFLPLPSPQENKNCSSSCPHSIVRKSFPLHFLWSHWDILAFPFLFGKQQWCHPFLRGSFMLAFFHHQMQSITFGEFFRKFMLICHYLDFPSFVTMQGQEIEWKGKPRRPPPQKKSWKISIWKIKIVMRRFGKYHSVPCHICHSWRTSTL